MRYKGIAGALVLLTLLLPVSAVAETIFWLDTPADGATVFGLVEVNGFVVDNGEQCGPQWTWHSCQWADALVSKIDLYVDDEYVATADMNQPRYDILQAYPWYAGTPYARPGFTTSFDSQSYSDGVHTLFVRVTFSDASTEDYGLRSVNIDNDLNQAPFGEIELPGSLQPMNGVFPITGWAMDDDAIAYVEIMVDGLAMGNAVTGVHRPDIGSRFPSDPDAEYAGFIRMLNTTALNNGIHVLAVRVVDNEGASRVIGRRFVQTFNTGSNLPPFGDIDWPVDNHVMYADGCELAQDGQLPPWSGEVFDDPDNVEMIIGWALDVGSRTDMGGVAYVQLLLDGNIIADTNEGSFYWDPAEWDFNYYGHERMDIHNLYVDVPQSKHSGFSFLVDVNYLILAKGYSQGLHLFKVRAGDRENNVTDIAQLPVIFDCNDDADDPSWGDIWTPEHMERVAGTVEITGFAIDTRSFRSVEIWIDGSYIGDADIGLPSPDLADLYPWLPPIFGANRGFSYELDTVGENLADGEHSLVVWTEDNLSGRNIIGERRFVLDNQSP
jgi:N-acetylmuramoyl-L-alanine amidase